MGAITPPIDWTAVSQFPRGHNRSEQTSPDFGYNPRPCQGRAPHGRNFLKGTHGDAANAGPPLPGQVGNGGVASSFIAELFTWALGWMSWKKLCRTMAADRVC